MGNCKSSSANSPSGKIIVNPADIPALLAEVENIKAKFPDNAMAQNLTAEYVNSLTPE